MQLGKPGPGDNMGSAPRIYIRTARAEDRQAVLHFAANTFEWGDYLPLVWDHWLSDPTGKFLAATIKRQPVAVARVALLSPNEAWLEGLRVDPVYRQQGIATVLTRRCLKEAKALGASVVRFVTRSTNDPVHRMAAATGFEKMFVMTPYRAGGLRSGPLLIRPKIADAPRLLAFLKVSPVLAAMGGLCNLGWRFLTLSGEVLKERVKRRRLRIVEEGNKVAALAMTLPSYRRQGLGVGYLDGREPAVRELLLGLRAEAAACESPEITIWAPEAPCLKRSLFEAGFVSEAGHAFWVYQRKLESLES